MSNLATALPETLLTHRQQFPALQNKLYFNYGGQGPLPKAALDAIVDSYRFMQEHGPFSNAIGGWATEQIAAAHQTIATELGVTPDTITLTESVSVGCNIALWGLPWQTGDHLLLSDCEHPSIIAAAQELSRRYGVIVDTCHLLNTLNEGDPIAAVTAQVTPQTRLVAISHILWNTGQVLPLADIIAACRQQHPEILILVDAAQSVGVMPLDLLALDVDFYAFTGHKWWCGPDGLGGLYVKSALREALPPTFIGWRGIQVDAQGTPNAWKPNGARYEVATSAFPLLAGLTTAIQVHQSWGSPLQRFERIQQLSDRLWQNLRQIPKIHCLHQHPPAAGLVSFHVEGCPPATLVKNLEAQKICIRTILNPICVRACVHYLTLEAETDTLVEQIAAMAQSL
jgi:L-cysteine/cystine lyase